MNRGNIVAVHVDPRLRYPLAADTAEMLDRQAPLYQAVEKVVADAGYPRLGGLVKPGDRVVLKPNWVSDQHPLGDNQIFGNITHGAILAALADMAMEQAGPDGEVMVAEVTTQEANFVRASALAGMWRAAAALEARHGRAVEILDLRSQVARIGADGLVHGLRRAPGLGPDGYPFGDPTGYWPIDLGDASEHAGRDDLAHLLRVTDHTFAPHLKLLQAEETTDQHRPGRHRYCLPRLVLSADVFICVPKLKTHVKAGVSLALKNLIGINARKALIPHRKEGATNDGGDECPVTAQLEGLEAGLKANLEHVRETRDANWFGNDTLWRTILDLNKILRYGTAGGRMSTMPQRRYLAVVDGIQASDGEGPTRGNLRQEGVLLAGDNPVHVDTVAATLMGFDWRAFPHIARAYGLAPAVRLVDAGPSDIQVRSSTWPAAAWHSPRRAQGLAFTAAPGWITRVELP